MAKRTRTELVDDLDGRTIEEGGPVRFSLEGRAYEIDLSAANAERMREELQPFITAARRVGGSSSPRQRSRSEGGLNAIRRWARENGHEVSDRGRVPVKVVEAFRQAQ